MPYPDDRYPTVPTFPRPQDTMTTKDKSLMDRDWYEVVCSYIEDMAGGGGSILTAHNGTTTANWNSGFGSSGIIGADLVNIPFADPGLLRGLIIDTTNLTLGGTIYVQLWQKINNIERMVYETAFTVGTDTPGLPVVNGSYAVDDYIRCEIYSTKITDDGKAVGYTYFTE